MSDLAMSRVIKEAEPGFNVANGKAAMWLFLASDAMSFGGLLVAYSVLRASHPAWPEPSAVLGLGMTAAMTFLLICSSVTMVLALHACHTRDLKGFRTWLGLTILGGVLFLCGQAFEYHHLITEKMSMPHGLYAQNWTGPFAATFFGTTGFHGMHVLGGVIYLSVIWLKGRNGKYLGDNFLPVEMVGLYWHFVDLIWILVFTFVYLIPVKG
jgi:heme/copper-type cytochrome/quinol oxidase subunit 3